MALCRSAAGGRSDASPRPLRHVPESRDEHAGKHLDFVGSALLTIGLAGVVYALIEGPGGAWDGATVTIGIVGVLALVAFVFVEARIANPMVPPR